eukprot:SAG11_NODE_7381_length_1152_cov_1.962013_1_plen_165_part_00
MHTRLVGTRLELDSIQSYFDMTLTPVPVHVGRALMNFYGTGTLGQNKNRNVLWIFLIFHVSALPMFGSVIKLAEALSKNILGIPRILIPEFFLIFFAKGRRTSKSCYAVSILNLVQNVWEQPVRLPDKSYCTNSTGRYSYWIPVPVPILYLLQYFMANTYLFIW